MVALNPTFSPIYFFKVSLDSGRVTMIFIESVAMINEDKKGSAYINIQIIVISKKKTSITEVVPVENVGSNVIFGTHSDGYKRAIISDVIVNFSSIVISTASTPKIKICSSTSNSSKRGCSAQEIPLR